MSPLHLGAVESVAMIGAHPDDIEIAAGGSLLALVAAHPGVRVHYVLCTGTPSRQSEARAAVAGFLAGAQVTVDLHELPDGRLPAYWNEVKEIVESASAALDAQLVLSPWCGDAHQDHRLLGELVPTAFRNALHLQYEIPKWDGDLGRPNVYLPLTASQLDRKVELLTKCFPSQQGRYWWRDDTFASLARLRGMEARCAYAEAFHATKLVLTPPAPR